MEIVCHQFREAWEAPWVFQRSVLTIAYNKPIQVQGDEQVIKLLVSVKINTFLFFLILIFYCYSITVVCPFSPSLHPTPADPPPSPTSTLPLDFVHVSFIVVPVIPSSHCPPPLAIGRLLLTSMSLVIFCLLFFFC